MNWETVPASGSYEMPVGEWKRQRDAIQRVRDLHKPATYADGVVACMAENCHESHANYPCETIRALDGEQG